MEEKELLPEQIITLNDYPVHNERILELYYRIYKNGCSKIVPFCPLIHKEIVLTFLDSELLTKFKEFESNHPKAEYFMLDGSHRTTAATLTKSPIRGIIIENDQDLIKAKSMIDQGDVLSNDIVEKNIKENCLILNDHFKEKPFFQTVKEKTERMIKEKIIAKYLFEGYSESNL